MKLYCYYLILPDNIENTEYSEIHGLHTITTKFYNENTGKWYYLYAFTNDKKIGKMFEEIHDMNIFRKTVKPIDSKDYDIFKADNIMSELLVYDIKKEVSYTEYPVHNSDFIVCTKNEEYDITETFTDYVNELLMEKCQYDYYHLKTKYIESLDYLLYCTLNRVNFYDSDFYSYNFSYGSTAEGYPRGPVSMKINILALYVKKFASLLRKD